MSDVQMCRSLRAECVEFLSQRRSGAVLMESRHGEGETDKQGLYQRRKKRVTECRQLIFDTCLDGQPVKSYELRHCDFCFAPRTCHASRQPLQNRPSGHHAGWATPWSAEKMLDGQHESVDVPAHARAARLTMASSRKDCKIISAESPLMPPPPSPRPYS